MWVPCEPNDGYNRRGTMEGAKTGHGYDKNRSQAGASAVKKRSIAWISIRATSSRANASGQCSHAISVTLVPRFSAAFITAATQKVLNGTDAHRTSRPPPAKTSIG
jgi:hypothetical protein